MSEPTPDLDALLALLPPLPDLEGRLDAASRLLLGRPYLVGPLVGGPETTEQPVFRTDGFDCVTYVETVLALARSANAAAFPREILGLRYDGGRVSWLDRNHYMSLWLERNARDGAVQVLEGTSWSRTPPRVLDCLQGFPPLTRQVTYLPLDRVKVLERRARAGDVVLFVSTRADLDTFHVGVLTRPAPPSLWVRHASRSRQAVVQEPLSEFLGRNTLPGVMVARPLLPKEPLA